MPRPPRLRFNQSIQLPILSMRFSIAVERRQQYLRLPCELLFADRPVASRREKFVIAGDARKRLAACCESFLFHDCGDAVSFLCRPFLWLDGRRVLCVSPFARLYKYNAAAALSQILLWITFWRLTRYISCILAGNSCQKRAAGTVPAHLWTLRTIFSPVSGGDSALSGAFGIKMPYRADRAILDGGARFRHTPQSRRWLANHWSISCAPCCESHKK